MSAVRTSELERQLAARLRDSAAGSPRAMSATVVVASGAEAAEGADGIVDSLMGLRPARVLHLRARGAENRSWTSARCSLDRQNRGVCFEDLFLESADEGALDPRIWGTLAIRDLPVLLLWLLPLDRLAEDLERYSERTDLFLVDPALAAPGDAPPHPELLIGLAARRGLADLGWDRLAPLRFGVARLFDPAPRILGDLRSVRISWPDEWGGRLLEGWLASRLGWKGRPGSRRSEAAAIRTETEVSGAGAEFLFADGTCASVSLTGEGTTRLERPDGTVSEIQAPPFLVGESLARYVDAPVGDPLYLDALRSLSYLPDR